jgi:Zn-dependent protease
MAQQPSFRLLGFPVTITPGFVLGMLLLLAINQRDVAFGIGLVGAITAFTLVHELGHATAARRYGADAAISLNFLVGYAIFRPNRPMTRGEQATISAAGPLVQIVLGVAALLALGVDPLSHASAGERPLTLAIWWAGPVLGLVNLLPLLPLDGGNIVALGTDAVAPGRGYTLVRYWSLACCGVLVVLVLTQPAWRPWALSVALFTFWAAQGLLHDRRRGKAPDPDASRRLWQVALDAEREGWEHGGSPGLFPPGMGPSPWLRAHALQRAGKDATARGLLVQALERDTGGWAPPNGATVDQLAPLLALVPDDAPVTDERGAWTHLRLLHATGMLTRAATYGARLYAEHPSPELAQQVARSLALAGHADEAVAWLRVACSTAVDTGLLDDPELAGLQGRPDMDALRAEVVRRAGGYPSPS